VQCERLARSTDLLVRFIDADRRDDEVRDLLIENELEATHVTPVHVVRTGAFFALVMANLRATRRTAPRHDVKPTPVARLLQPQTASTQTFNLSHNRTRIDSGVSKTVYACLR